MNTRTWTRTVVVTGVAAIGIAGFGAAPTAEAKRDAVGGARAVYPLQVDEIVDMRKVTMAHDYVAYAAARAEWAAHR